MLEIDGSLGEGGGQILRTAIALSSMIQKPVKIFNIRKNRSNPGLRPQHITSIKVLAEFTNAKIGNLKESSTELIFEPTQKISQNKSFNIGTAGSISLLIQAIAPYCITLDKPVSLEFIGGTNVKWSPPIEYLQQVLLPILQKMNVIFKITLIKRGFYPKGAGKVKVDFIPSKTINPILLDKNQSINKINLLSYASNLPMHIITRQAAAASNIIKNSEIYNKEIPFEIKEENPKESLSPGSGILICATLNKGGIIGSDSLGEKGLSAEKVGEKAAYNLINQIKTGASIDKNMADMIIPFLAFAQGKSKIYIPELTNHTLTNIQIVELMTEIKFRINKESNGLILLEVEGKKLEDR